MDIQSIYQQAIKYAAKKHAAINQTIPDSELPYVVHLSNVAMEILIASTHSTGFDLAFAIQVALLHDVLEDTPTTFDEISGSFGPFVAEGVLALTKNDNLPKHEKMMDSLNRVKRLQPEVWAVKLADRITNLQEPPGSWENEKKIKYLQEAKEILRHLKGATFTLRSV